MSTNGLWEKSVNNEIENFTSTCGEIEVGERKYIIRVLKMNNSTMMFIGNAGSECLDEMAVAMHMANNQEVVGTTILGSQFVSNSQNLAEKLSKRYQRQFFISYNTNMDRFNEILMEQQLNNYIRANIEQFT